VSKFWALFLILGCVSTVVATAHTEKNRPNSLGVEESYQNPNIYLFAEPLDGKIMDSVTNIRFQPYATPALYDESILFCGNVAGDFEGKRGPMVVTYRRAADRIYKGLACHDLISVFEVKSEMP